MCSFVYQLFVQMRAFFHQHDEIHFPGNVNQCEEIIFGSLGIELYVLIVVNSDYTHFRCHS